MDNRDIDGGSVRRIESAGEPEFAGKVAIVTGASSGIGQAVAGMLAAAGASVVIVARNSQLLDHVAMGARGIVPKPADLTDSASIDRLFDEVEAEFGGCDILVNSAGFIDPKRATEMELAAWNHHFQVNVTAVFLTSRRAVVSMKRRGGGSIVNVASISGVPGPQKFPGFSAYCASKAAVIAFTECLAVELKDDNIRVNAVSPGSVDTPMLRRANAELRPDMTAGEVAGAILFLASSRSRPINGQNLHVYSV
jgi:NAD(P)-dependent dehydrogenase (short-subunit alcohol dehydrogenase family)